jgi:hypothetical protein
MRYRLRSLLILLAILPPLLAVSWWKYLDWRAEQERLRAMREQATQQVQIEVVIATGVTLTPQPAPPLPLLLPPEDPASPRPEVPAVKAPGEPRE